MALPGQLREAEADEILKIRDKIKRRSVRPKTVETFFRGVGFNFSREGNMG